eukprot:COSAG06_NODE_3206_length_5684_cov_4.900286_1_plen_261_part_00
MLRLPVPPCALRVSRCRVNEIPTCPHSTSLAQTKLESDPELSDLVRRGLVNPRRLSDPLYATRIRQQLTRRESGVVAADGSKQYSTATSRPNTLLYSGDNGASSDPTLLYADFNAPVERGGADAHTGAFLFAHSIGNNTGIQRLHVGPYTCDAAHELAIVRLINVAGSSATPGLYRTGLSSIANLDTYIRTLSSGTGTLGYGGLSYTKSTNPQGGDFDATVNYFYVWFSRSWLSKSEDKVPGLFAREWAVRAAPEPLLHS